MLDKSAVIKIVKELELPTSEYIVFSGGSLAVYGIRDTSDVDIVATPKLFSELKEDDGWELTKRSRDNTEFLRKDNIDIASKLEWEDYPVTLAEAKERENIIEGIPFMGLPDVVQFKQAFGREKDKRDIQLIKEYLQANS